MATLFKTATMREAANKPQAGSIAWLNDCIERSRDGFFYLPVMMTPPLAAELLRRNPDNRIVRDHTVERYASDMKAGRWDGFNGESIKISDDGLLNDGQNRCHAVIEANMSVPMVIGFGFARKSRETLDQGEKRTAGNYLQMAGYADTNNTSAIAKLLIAYERNNGTMLGSRNGITHTEITARVRADGAIHDSLRYCVNCKASPRGMITLSAIAFCHYVFADLDEADANDFILQVLTGEGLKRKMPAYAVRQRLLSDSRGSKLSGSAKVAKIEIVMRGWNSFRLGKNMESVPVLGSFPALV